MNGTLELCGPEQFRLDQFIRWALAARSDSREVIADSNARYFGIKVQEKTLLPDSNARLSRMRFEQWLAQPPAQPAKAHVQPA